MLPLARLRGAARRADSRRSRRTGATQVGAAGRRRASGCSRCSRWRRTTPPTRASRPRAAAAPIQNRAGVARRVVLRPRASSWSAIRSGGRSLVGARAWLGALARALRSDARRRRAPPPSRAARGRVARPGAAARRQRVARMDAPLPVGRRRSPAATPAACSALVLGRASQSLLGFAGSGVLWIAVLVAGASLALRFSWLRVADAHRRARSSRCATRRVERDRARRGRAPRRRRRCASATRCSRSSTSCSEQHLPIVIEPTLVDVPKSTRVVKERQKPLFSELVDTKLPQVDLLDAAPQRVETRQRRDARDDLAPDREEAEGLRRRGARRRRLARPGDHALRDRAGHSASRARRS